MDEQNTAVIDPFCNVDATEHQLCADFWVWLESERVKRNGREPTDEEIIAKLAPLRAYRANSVTLPYKGIHVLEQLE